LLHFRQVFCNKQTRKESIPFSYTMNEQNSLLFAVPSQLNDALDVSGVPKAATIFYLEKRWWFELKVGQSSGNELDKHKRDFDFLKQKSYGLNIAAGPFGKKFPVFSYDF
jgi:hypothetical protein